MTAFVYEKEEREEKKEANFVVLIYPQTKAGEEHLSGLNFYSFVHVGNYV